MSMKLVLGCTVIAASSFAAGFACGTKYDIDIKKNGADKRKITIRKREMSDGNILYKGETYVNYNKTLGEIFGCSDEDDEINMSEYEDIIDDGNDEPVGQSPTRFAANAAEAMAMDT